MTYGVRRANSITTGLWSLCGAQVSNGPTVTDCNCATLRLGAEQ